MNIQLKNLSAEETNELLPNNLIFLGYRGSIAHEMYIASTDPNSIDDKDLIGIFIAPKDHYLGIQHIKETKEKFIKEWDSVSYEFKKMISLLLKANPNVLAVLWLKQQHILYQSEYYQLLRENRDLFSSKQAYHSFSGYAWGQFKRMAHYKFEGYMGEKRKQLVIKYGYDCKNATCLIRLLKMGIEFLTEGVLYVARASDNQMLLEIKQGYWSLEKVKQEAERLFKLTEEAYIHSKLPDQPDYSRINKLTIDILENYLYKGQL